MKLIKYLTLSLAMASAASAAQITFVTPVGSTTSGGPVNASATFTTSANTLNIQLTNLQANITDVAQALSDLFFTIDTAATATLTNSSGQEITVAGNGTATLGAVVATGWPLDDAGGPSFHLNVLAAGGAGPAHLILGPPGPGGVYTNANGSIAGNGPHNPFFNQTATFTLSIPGITANTIVTSAIFSFGTTAGINVPGIPNTPDSGATLMLFGIGLVGAEVLRRSIAKRSAVKA